VETAPTAAVRDVGPAPAAASGQASRNVALLVLLVMAVAGANTAWETPLFVLPDNSLLTQVLFFLVAFLLSGGGALLVKQYARPSPLAWWAFVPWILLGFGIPGALAALVCLALQASTPLPYAAAAAAGITLFFGTGYSVIRSAVVPNEGWRPGFATWAGLALATLLNLAVLSGLTLPITAGLATARPTLVMAPEAEPVAELPPTAGAMVVVRPGGFQMGTSPGATESGVHSDEQPAHWVSFPKAFLISRTEVSFAEYDSFARETGRALPSDDGWGRGQRPVVNVTWGDARAYAAWLTEKTGRSFRLPSEAEWEFAARAGVTTDFYWGDQPDHDFANFGSDTCCDGAVAGSDSWMFTAPVASFPANPLGLHDMLGNVAEWIEDCYEPGYEGASTEGKARVDCSTDLKVTRGGSWRDRGIRLRLAFRDSAQPDTRSNRIGFRLVADE
jgi:formylglycine-generating enzyme required for sulfatase activity